jgi:hypothetical protein
MIYKKIRMLALLGMAIVQISMSAPEPGVRQSLSESLQTLQSHAEALYSNKGIFDSLGLGTQKDLSKAADTLATGLAKMDKQIEDRLKEIE